jgi:hypothetical protein
MVRGLGSSKRRVAEGGEEEEEEYEVADVGHERITSSLGNRLGLLASDFRLRRPRHCRRPLAGADSFFHNLVIHPENKYVTVLLLATSSVL